MLWPFHIFHRVAEYLAEFIHETVNHFVLIGLFFIGVGASPEKWYEDALEKLDLWKYLADVHAEIDLRVFPITVGVVIIVGDWLWRHHSRGPSPRRDRDEAPELEPSFSLLIKELIGQEGNLVGLVGREWVFDAINAWRTGRKEKCMLIVGEAGIGKSAIAADLPRRYPSQLLAYHFCQRRQRDTLGPERFVRNLSAMLRRRLPEYAARTQKVSSGFSDPVSYFRNEVLAPLNEISREKGSDGDYFILVDALDEASLLEDAESKLTIVRLLRQHLGEFPPWLRLLATTRPDDRDVIDNAYEFLLDANDPRNKQDVEQYVQARLASAPESVRSADFVGVLVERSECNVLYLRFVTEAILHGRDYGRDIEKLPRGLWEFYKDDFRDHFGDASGANYKRLARLLGVVVAAKEPLTADLLERAIEPAALDPLLQQLKPYVPIRGDNTYTFFHQSIREWLISRPNPYLIDEHSGHEDLADVALEMLRTLQDAPDIESALRLHSYMVRNGVHHLIESDRFAAAVDCLTIFQDYRALWESITNLLLDGLIKRTFFRLRDRLHSAVRDGNGKLEGEIRQINPDKLIKLVQDFYEIDPLSGPLDVLVRYHHDQKWPDRLTTLLSSDNFVVRYALSDAMADACTRSNATITAFELSTLLTEGKTFNHRELGAYTLRLIYTRTTGEIDPKSLEQLAKSCTYPGRSALADLLLNLVLQREPRHQLVQNPDFWQPIWEFHKLDIWDLKAAELLMANQDPPPSTAAEVRAVYQTLKGISNLRGELLMGRRPSLIRSLLEGYWSLGRDLDQLSRTRKELAEAPDLKKLMQLLFAHPLWAVGEAAATVMSSIAEEDPQQLKLMSELLEDEPWRLGAIEAAFASRHLNRTIFFIAVRKFYDHCNPRVRGLCAENLVSMVLNERNSEASKQLIWEFEREICYWLRDEDCWVLEHMYRLIHTLWSREMDFSQLLSNGVSRLFAGKETDWFTLGREPFLLLIEERKVQIVSRLRA